MPWYVPLVVFFLWFTFIAACMGAKEILWPKTEGWQEVLFLNLVLSVSALVGIAVIFLLAKRFFVQGLKGLGLNLKTIVRDFGGAFLNLFGAMPIIVAMIVGTIIIGQLIWGEDFQLKQHEQLQMMGMYPQVSLRIVIIVTAVVIAPIFEEMLFRGLIQTMLRSILMRPWAAIFVTSCIFAMVHGNVEHWPAIAALGMCLGYAYEKSGSLIRSIFIHSMFNAISVIGVLCQ